MHNEECQLFLCPHNNNMYIWPLLALNLLRTEVIIDCYWRASFLVGGHGDHGDHYTVEEACMGSASDQAFSKLSSNLVASAANLSPQSPCRRNSTLNRGIDEMARKRGETEVQNW